MENSVTWPFPLLLLLLSCLSCLTLGDPIDRSPPGSPVPGILQTRTLEWVVISFSSAWKWKVKVKSLSCVWLLATPWTSAYQAPSVGFSSQEYWSGLPWPSPILSDHLTNELLVNWLWRMTCWVGLPPFLEYLPPLQFMWSVSESLLMNNLAIRPFFVPSIALNSMTYTNRRCGGWGAVGCSLNETICLHKIFTGNRLLLV